MKNLLKQMRRPKLLKKIWITRKELFKYSDMVMWLFNVSERSDTRAFIKSVSVLWDKSGSNFTFLYLKETMRLIVRFLANSPETLPSFNGVRVKVDFQGIPKIIPLNWRHLLAKSQENALMVRYILTLVSIFRVFPTCPKISFSTIVSPFSGTQETLDLSNVSKFRINFNRKCRFIKLESSSPMSIKALWGSANDIIPFLFDIRKAYELSLLYIKFGGYHILVWFWFLLLISTLLYPLYFFESFHFGRLGIVYDQAGKARVVALTNYWIQVGLYPIHKSIFDHLRNLSTDGTFDQLKPLDILISKESDEMFYCFDLSAATDRLPIKLQKDILNSLYEGLGDLWSSILSLNWYYKKTSYKYSVGQPMGAYSSWAMLALTHHMIVRFSAANVGIKDFTDYAVLGDDIVIRNKAVAEEYLSVMNNLGVSINLGKSVISKDFAEFAKVWKGPHVNFTPIGPGLILRTIRDKAYIGSLLAEAFKTRLFVNYGACIRVLQKLRTSYRSQSFIGIWSCIGLKGAFWKMRPSDVSYLKKSISWCLASKSSESLMVRFQLFNALRGIKHEMYIDTITRITNELDYFNRNWNQRAGRNWSGRLFETLVRLVSPGLWIYFVDLVKDSFGILDSYIKFYFREWNCTWEEIMELVNDPSFDVTSIDWSNRRAILDNAKLCKKVRAYSHLIGVKSEDGSFGSLDSLVIEPTVDTIFLKKEVTNIRDLKPLIRYPRTTVLHCRTRPRSRV